MPIELMSIPVLVLEIGTGFVLLHIVSQSRLRTTSAANNRSSGKTASCLRSQNGLVTRNMAHRSLSQYLLNIRSAEWI